MNTEQTTEKAQLSQLEIKELRASIQRYVDVLRDHQGSRELSLVITKLEEAKMWAGKHLGNIGSEDWNAERDAVELESTESSGKF